MKKSTLYTGIGYLSFGILCLLMAIFLDLRLKPLLWGFTGAGICPGIIMLTKYFYWSKPEHKAEYEELLHKETIEMRDERKVMLRDKSARLTYLITIGFYCILMLLFSICNVMGWFRPFSSYAVIGIAILLIFQLICGNIAYHHLEKKL